LLGELLSEIQTPVQVISSSRDILVPPVNGEYLHERLPHSRLELLDAAHYPWEDAANQYAALILAWIQDGYLHPNQEILSKEYTERHRTDNP
jgi:pimeloyl-ACP methyl ester carboxylesterase